MAGLMRLYNMKSMFDNTFTTNFIFLPQPPKHSPAQPHPTTNQIFKAFLGLVERWVKSRKRALKCNRCKRIDTFKQATVAK